MNFLYVDYKGENMGNRGVIFLKEYYKIIYRIMKKRKHDYSDRLALYIEIFAILCVYLIAINYKVNNMGMIYASIIGIILSIALIIMIKMRLGKEKLIEVCFGTYSIYFSMILAITGGHDGAGPIWIIAFAALLIFVLGAKVGGISGLVILIGLFCLFRTPLYYELVQYDYTEGVRTNIPLVYMLCYGICMTSEMARKTAIEKLVCIKDLYARNLEQNVKLKTQHIEDIQNQIIYSFAEVIEGKDYTTGHHIKRTSEYVKLIINNLKKNGYYKEILTQEYIDAVCKAAPLHDIGKVTISDSILCKPGKLKKDEFDIMKEHTLKGGVLLENSLKKIEDDKKLEVAKEMAVYHHEKWNGTGYPYGLSKNEIPLCARIMAVADVFDALVSERPYKKAFSLDKAMQIIEESSGNHFEPCIVNVFVSGRVEVERLLHKMQTLEKVFI